MPRAIAKPFARGFRPEMVLWLIGAAAVAQAGATLYCQALHSLGAHGVMLPVLLVVLGAATISSIAGFAFSALCGTALLHLVPNPIEAVQIMLVCSIGIQSLSVWSVRRQIDWITLSRLLVGGLAGLPAGLWLLTHLSRQDYAHTLGALLTLYGLWMLLRGRGVTWAGAPRLTGLVGILGGITGGMAALPGPFVVIWCGMQGWNKGRQRCVTQPFILSMQILALAMLHAMGPAMAADTAIGLNAWGYVPAALVGTAIGLHIFRRLTDGQFGVAVNAWLIASGAGLLL